jgi:hypothetical protein
MLMRMDLIVPFAVKCVGFDEDVLHFSICDFASFFVLIGVEPAMDFQAGFGSSRSNELDDNFQGFEWGLPANCE